MIAGIIVVGVHVLGVHLFVHAIDRLHTHEVEYAHQGKDKTSATATEGHCTCTVTTVWSLYTQANALHVRDPRHVYGDPPAHHCL